MAPDSLTLTETRCIDKSGRMTEPEADAMPRWVKIFGILAVVAVVAFLVLHLTGLAPHGH